MTTNRETHGETLGGTVHVCHETTIGRQTLLAPSCRRYRLDQLLAVIETMQPVTCKRCLAKVQNRVADNRGLRSMSAAR